MFVQPHSFTLLPSFLPSFLFLFDSHPDSRPIRSPSLPPPSPLSSSPPQVGLSPSLVNVLGILRCNWGEITAITGIAVTPVVGYVGELSEVQLTPNAAEVAECFTVPLSVVLDQSNWVRPSNNETPVFTGGPHVIWGLTAYILDRFAQDVLARYRISFRAEGEGGGSGEEGGVTVVDRRVKPREGGTKEDFKF